MGKEERKQAQIGKLSPQKRLKKLQDLKIKDKSNNQAIINNLVQFQQKYKKYQEHFKQQKKQTQMSVKKEIESIRNRAHFQSQRADEQRDKHLKKLANLQNNVVNLRQKENSRSFLSQKRNQSQQYIKSTTSISKNNTAFQKWQDRMHNQEQYADSLKDNYVVRYKKLSQFESKRFDPPGIVDKKIQKVNKQRAIIENNQFNKFVNKICNKFSKKKSVKPNRNQSEQQQYSTIMESQRKYNARIQQYQKKLQEKGKIIQRKKKQLQENTEHLQKYNQQRMKRNQKNLEQNIISMRQKQNRMMQAYIQSKNRIQEKAKQQQLISQSFLQHRVNQNKIKGQILNKNQKVLKMMGISSQQIQLLKT